MLFFPRSLSYLVFSLYLTLRLCVTLWVTKKTLSNPILGSQSIRTHHKNGLYPICKNWISCRFSCPDFQKSIWTQSGHGQNWDLGWQSEQGHRVQDECCLTCLAKPFSWHNHSSASYTPASFHTHLVTHTLSVAALKYIWKEDCCAFGEITQNYCSHT